MTEVTGRQRRLLRDELYEEILAAIVDGTLEPGEPLTDESLMAWLDASRVPIREALARLAQDGLVEMLPNRRTRVASLDARDVNEALFVTGILHEASMRETSGQLSDESRAALEHLRDEARDALARGDVRSLSVAVGEFFLVFERASANSAAVATVEAQTTRLVRFLTPRPGLVANDRLVEMLGAITTAALSGNGDEAADITHDLYAPTRENFFALYRDA